MECQIEFQWDDKLNDKLNGEMTNEKWKMENGKSQK